ncbi:hypothetical protein LIP81_22280, partial [Erysipelatoclostridium ramosum]|nr:hypothetical protein [Thomasclavelia ramosa]
MPAQSGDVVQQLLQSVALVLDEFGNIEAGYFHGDGQLHHQFVASALFRGNGGAPQSVKLLGAGI